MSGNKKKYIKVPQKIKNEIRARYELGEDLTFLACAYKINYGTLKNYASKNNWEKGSRAEVIYLQSEAEFESSAVQTVQNLEKAHLVLHSKIVEEMVEEAKQGNLISSKAREEARNLRVKTLVALREDRKDMFNIRTELEELKYKKDLIEYEEAKLRFERLKAGDQEVIELK